MLDTFIFNTFTIHGGSEIRVKNTPSEVRLRTKDIIFFLTFDVVILTSLKIALIVQFSIYISGKQVHLIQRTYILCNHNPRTLVELIQINVLMPELTIYDKVQKYPVDCPVWSIFDVLMIYRKVCVKCWPLIGGRMDSRAPIGPTVPPADGKFSRNISVAFVSFNKYIFLLCSLYTVHCTLYNGRHAFLSLSLQRKIWMNPRKISK